MKKLRKSCSNCVLGKKRYKFGDSGSITFFCYCCMMDDRKEFKPIEHPTEKDDEGKSY